MPLKPKYSLGQAVEVEFIGAVTGVKLTKDNDGKEIVEYTVDGKRIYASRIPESSIFPLPEEDPNPDHERP